MNIGALSSEDVEAAKVLWGLQDLVPAAECRNRRRRVTFLQWGCRRRRSTTCSNRLKGKAFERNKSISPTTPLPSNPIACDGILRNPNLNSATTTVQHNQMQEQNYLILSLSSTKAHLERSVEEAKRRYRMLKERNCLLKNMQAEKRQYQMLKERSCLLRNMQAEIARKQQEQDQEQSKQQQQQQQQIVLDLFREGALQQQQQRRPALDLNRSAAVAEAMLAWQRRTLLSAQARKRRMLLQKAKSSSLHKLVVSKMS